MRRVLSCVSILVVCAAIAEAQPTSTTRLVPYAGIAVDAAGSPLAGELTVTFELFEEQDGGEPLWREKQRVVADARGRYVANLGSVTSIPQIVFTQERARWLAVTVADHPLPRVMLVAVPYALRAADAETVGGQPASAFVRARADGKLETSAGLVVSEPAIEGSGNTNSLAKFGSPTTITSAGISEIGGRVGFGLADPTGGGVVDSVFSIRNFDNNTGFAVLNQTQQRRFALNTLPNGGWSLYDGVFGTWNVGITQWGGRLGVAVPPANPPQAQLHVHNLTNGLPAFQSEQYAEHYAILARSPVTAIKGITSAFILDTGRIDWPEAGVFGYGEGAAAGVFGATDASDGVFGWTITGTAVKGQSIGTGLAGNFIGGVTVSGTLTKGGGSFKIDHPLDPTNKYLSHSFVESPDMMNVYNGNVTLDVAGEAWVNLPEWFETLNRDFRYQLTALGAPGPNLYIASEVAGNRFKIAGGTPSGRVSWQITGIRQDAWANAHRIQVEEDKAESERGGYLHPQEHGQPESASPAQSGITRPASASVPKPQ